MVEWMLVLGGFTLGTVVTGCIGLALLVKYAPRIKM